MIGLNNLLFYQSFVVSFDITYVKVQFRHKSVFLQNSLISSLAVYINYKLA